MSEHIQTTLHNQAQRIHFIGIGGIGMSALATMYANEGKEVSGSDREESDITTQLQEHGIAVTVGHRADLIDESIDLVVYSKAVPGDNPEYVSAGRAGIPRMSYPELLGAISSEKYTIAVSGTHGKTTTTALLASIMLDASYDPTVVIGGKFSQAQTNLIAGTSDYFIAEACEFKRSFLELAPQVLIITNIEADHLDYYADLTDIQQAFQELAEKVPDDGVIICDPSSVVIAGVLEHVDADIIDYTQYLEADFELSLPGEYNRENAAAAYAAAQYLGVEASDIQASLETFSGLWRRFEYKGRTESGAHVYDDYAHHPTEITALLAGMRERYPEERIIALFQPHLHSRTQTFLSEFAQSFDTADAVLVAPVYEARAEADTSVGHTDLVTALQNNDVAATAVDSQQALIEQARTLAGPGNVIVTIGAGDITAVSDALVQPLTEKFMYGI